MAAALTSSDSSERVRSKMGKRLSVCRNIYNQKDGWHQSYSPGHPCHRTPYPRGGCRKLHYHCPPEPKKLFSLTYAVSSSQSLLRKGRRTLGCNATKIIRAFSKASGRQGQSHEGSRGLTCRVRDLPYEES